MVRSLRNTALALLIALAMGGCGGVATPTATMTPTVPPSPLPTSIPTALPSLMPTATLPSAVLPICQEPSDLEIGEMTLTFVADWDGDEEIYLIQADGSGLVQFTDNTTDEARPKWSPNGSELAFLKESRGIASLNTSSDVGSDGRSVAQGLEDTSDFVWSPTGNKIYIRSWGKLVALDLTTFEVVKLTPETGYPNVPTFSPTGDRMVFQVFIPDAAPLKRIYTANADGTDLKELSFPQGDVYRPIWNPVRDEILFEGDVEGTGIGLYLATIDGTITRLPLEPKDGLSGAAWSPNGSMIIYIEKYPEATTDIPRHSIHIAAADGSKDIAVLQPPDEMEGEFVISEVIWAPDIRHIAYTVPSERGGPEKRDLFLLDICSGSSMAVVEAINSLSTPSWKPLPSQVAAIPTVISTVPIPIPTDAQVISPMNVPALEPVWQLVTDERMYRVEWSEQENLIGIGMGRGIEIRDFPNLILDQMILEGASSFAIRSDGGALMAGSPGAVTLWDLRRNLPVHEYRDPNDWTSSAELALSPEWEYLASSVAWPLARGVFVVIHIWEVDTNAKVRTIYEESIGYSFELAFGPDGRELASGSRLDRKVHFWDTGTGELLGYVEGERVQYSPDGELIATSESASVWIWDMQTKTLLQEFKVSGEGFELPISFSSDGNLFAAGKDEIIIWRTADWEEVTTLSIPGGGLQFLRFSPSGKYLASVHGHTTVERTDEYTVTIWAVKD